MIAPHGKCCLEVAASQGLTLKRHIDATLGQGKVREAVRLPPGEDLNEWLAVNTVDFYNAISVLYSTLDECCTATTCPIMSAGPKVCFDAAIAFIDSNKDKEDRQDTHDVIALFPVVLTAV